MTTLFDQLGSLTAVKNLANAFYDVMEHDPFARELRDIHPKKLISTRHSFYKFLAEWLGGPGLYGEQHMNPTWLELRHRRLQLSESNVEQWLYCMRTAMTNLELNEDLKQALNHKFVDMIESMQQQRASLSDSNRVPVKQA